MGSWINLSRCLIWRHVNATSSRANVINSIVFPCIKNSCFSPNKSGNKSVSESVSTAGRFYDSGSTDSVVVVSAVNQMQLDLTLDLSPSCTFLYIGQHLLHSTLSIASSSALSHDISRPLDDLCPVLPRSSFSLSSLRKPMQCLVFSSILVHAPHVA